MSVYDVTIVGGGIVGLATAMEWLAAFPDSRLILLEKEPQLGAHQTGHNSGVLHSGLYYRPGSLKARTCVEGKRLLETFCDAHGVPYRRCGKVVVAAEESERPALKVLYERGLANGVEGLALVGPERLKELEPHARGVAALHVPGTGVVDFAAVVQAMADLIRQRGGELRAGVRVTGLIRRGGEWIAQTTAGEIRSTCLVTCGGLHSDRLAAMAGGDGNVQIIPFRGEYYDLIPERRYLVRSLIYPVPDAALPFLGVHFTRTLDGEVHAGPNAVLALAREGYRKRDVSLHDTARLFAFSGFWRMAKRYWLVGVEEWHRSWSKPAFARALQRLVPEVRAEDLRPGGSGVRAQAVSAGGALLDDFEVVAGDHAVHVRNVPSPAATASISIARAITAMAAEAFGHKQLDASAKIR